MAGEVIPLPRSGFVIGQHLCRQPGPERHLMCFAERDHGGDHRWADWRGCRVRVPGYPGTVTFGGFAY